MLASNSAKICLQKSTNHKFQPLPVGYKDLWEKIREQIFGGPSNVSTRTAVVEQTRHMFARQKMEQTLVNCIHSQCTRICQLDFTQDGSLTLKLYDSLLGYNIQKI